VVFLFIVSYYAWPLLEALTMGRCWPWPLLEALTMGRMTLIEALTMEA